MAYEHFEKDKKKQLPGDEFDISVWKPLDTKGKPINQDEPLIYNHYSGWVWKNDPKVIKSYWKKIVCVLANGNLIANPNYSAYFNNINTGIYLNVPAISSNSLRALRFLPHHLEENQFLIKFSSLFCFRNNFIIQKFHLILKTKCFCA